MWFEPTPATTAAPSPSGDINISQKHVLWVIRNASVSRFQLILTTFVVDFFCVCVFFSFVVVVFCEDIRHYEHMPIQMY